MSDNGESIIFSVFMPRNSNGTILRHGFLHTVSTGLTAPVYEKMRPDLISEAPVVDISSDGRYALFYTDSISSYILGITDTNGSYELVVHDRVSNTYAVATIDASGTDTIHSGNLQTFSPQLLTDNGKVYVVYQSRAADVVPQYVSSGSDVFIVNVSDGITAQLSLNETNQPFYNDNIYLNDVAIRDGFVYAVMHSFSDQMYLRSAPLANLHEGTTITVGRRQSGGITTAFQGHVSDNGRWVIWSSFDHQIDPTDYNNSYDTYIRDTVSRVTKRLVSANGTELPFGSHHTRSRS